MSADAIDLYQAFRGETAAGGMKVLLC